MLHIADRSPLMQWLPVELLLGLVVLHGEARLYALLKFVVFQYQVISWMGDVFVYYHENYNDIVLQEFPFLILFYYTLVRKLPFIWRSNCYFKI